MMLPNLGNMGLIQRGDPDLMAPWLSPYPMHQTYHLWCSAMKIKPYAGGRAVVDSGRVIGFVQGAGTGRITSGYRQYIIGANEHSAHRFALAWDIHIGDAQEQGAAALVAAKYFNRVGLYPESTFIHVDLAPDDWISHYRKYKFWVRTGGTYIGFSNLREAVRTAQ